MTFVNVSVCAKYRILYWIENSLVLFQYCRKPPRLCQRKRKILPWDDTYAYVNELEQDWEYDPLRIAHEFFKIFYLALHHFQHDV